MLFFLSFAVAVGIWPGIVDLATAPRWATLAVGVPIALMVSPQLRSPLRGLGPLLLMVIASTLLWSKDVLEGVDAFVHLVILAGVFWLGASADDLRPAWAGLACGVTVSAIAAVAQVFGWQGIPQAVSPAGLFVNKNMLAEAGVVALIAMVLTKRWWLVPGPAIAILLPVSRGAIGALILTFAVWLYKRRPVLSAWIAVGVVLAFVSLALHSSSFNARIDFWLTALINLNWQGHGLGGFTAALPIVDHVHNEFIELLFDLGLLSFPIVFLFAYALGGPYEIERLVLFAILAIGCLSFPLHVPVTGFAAALAAGHLVAGRDRVRVPVDVWRSAHALAR